MALRHFSGHFGHGQLTYPHCTWATFLDNLQVLSINSFASNWQLPFSNQRKGENGLRNYFMTNRHERMLLDVKIKPVTVHIPGGGASHRASQPGSKCFDDPTCIFCISLICKWYTYFMYCTDLGLHCLPITVCPTDLGSITLKCNALHYNYFQNYCIILQLPRFWECNELHYNYFTKVMHYITITFWYVSHKSVTEHQDMHTIHKMIKCASYDTIAAIM